LRREILPNGVTLLVQRRRTAPAAAVVTHVRAGFLDEPDDMVGISHVLEHLIFKGTPRLPPGEFARRTKALGGALNAYTSYDRTVYYATVPSASAREALALQADSVRDPLVDAEELRRELGVIVQEAERKRDTPSAVAGETLHELLYDVHRLRRWRIGTTERIASFSREEVLGYHATRYVPSRVIAAMVSDLEDEAALDILRAEWGAWDRPAVPVPEGPTEPVHHGVRAHRLPGDVTQAEVVIGWRAPGPLDPSAHALELAAAILAAGRGARLSRALREAGLVSGVGASHYGAEDVGVFAIGVACEDARVPKVLGVIGATVRDLRERPAGRDELDRARALLVARDRRRLERYEARATALAGAESLGDVTRLDRESDDLLAVTADQVQHAVHAHLDPERVAGVASVPRTSAVAFDADALAAAVAVPAIRPLPLDAGPATVPSIQIHVPGHRQHEVHHLALDGVDILAARHGDVPQVSLTAWRRRDHAEGPEDAGVAMLAVRAMLRGTEQRDAGALALAMERLGGVLAPSVGVDLLGLGATVLSEHTAAATALISEAFHRPRFEASQVEIERGVLLEEAAAVTDDQLRYPMQLAFGQAFGDVGYGAPSLGTADSLRALDAAAVRAWHGQALARGRTTVVAVGDGDPAELAATVAGAFLPLVPSGGGMAAPLGPALMHPGERRRTRDRRQSALAMVFPGPSRAAPLRHAAEAWGAIAGGLGGRLFDALRDHRSLAYTVVATSWQRRRAGALLTYIATAPERLEEAREAMLEELALFRNAPPTEAELTRALGMLIGQTAVARQSAGALAGEIADAWLLGEGLHELDDPMAGYRTVTAAQVQEVAAGFDPARMAVGIVAASGAGSE
jgi:zinc protease